MGPIGWSLVWRSHYCHQYNLLLLDLAGHCRLLDVQVRCRVPVSLLLVLKASGLLFDHLLSVA